MKPFYRLRNRFMGLSVNNRVAFIIRCGTLVILALMWLSGHYPPAHAQQGGVIPVQQVHSDKDSDQDIEIHDITKDFHEFQQQQTDWNKQTGTQIGGLTDAVKDLTKSRDHNDGIIQGGIYVTAAMTFLAGWFTVKGKNDKDKKKLAEDC